MLTLGFILFANYAAMGITKVVSVSGFLGQVKDHSILLVGAVDVVLLILATGLQSLIVDRSKLEQQVKEIAENDFFQDRQPKVHGMRDRFRKDE